MGFDATAMKIVPLESPSPWLSNGYTSGEKEIYFFAFVYPYSFLYAFSSKCCILVIFAPITTSRYSSQ